MHQEFCPPYPMEQIKNHEHDQHHHLFSFGLNHQIVSSCDPTQDHAGFYHPQLFQPHHHPQDKYYGYGGGSSHEGENKIEVKKVKVKLKLNPSSSFSTNNTSSYHSNTTIRVCSDCHTTKTPLWRSGPKGPKSLCNACGIRQRKARRAMAAAKTGNGGRVASEQMKEKMKKCCKMGVGSSTSSGKKMGFEDFLINLSNKIAFHRVFPQDEKEAAILLMALSSGLVHG